MSQPYQTECRNDNRSDHWTCPGCYEDFNERSPGTHTCSKCGRKSECTIEQIETCQAILVETNDED